MTFKNLMIADLDLKPGDKLRIKKFFESNDAREYVRAFVAQSFGENSAIPRVKMVDPSHMKTEQQQEVKPVVPPIEPSLIVEIQKGAAFDEFHRSATKSTLQITVDVFGKIFTFKNIKGCQCPEINQAVAIPLPGDLKSLISKASPVRICVSTYLPELSFVGLGKLDWRKALPEGKYQESINMIGLQNEIVGVIKIGLKFDGFKEEVNFKVLAQPYDLQTRQETLDKIENDRVFSTQLSMWWKEFQQLIGHKEVPITARELGAGRTNIFDFITPFYIRSLITPGHCLRFAFLMSPIVAPAGVSNIPNWAAISSKCAGDREKHNILVSLLRGFGLKAFVVVAQPKCFAVSYSSSLMFYDANSGKFGLKPPESCKAVSFMYNESALYANLYPAELPINLDWDINNPLKWKMLEAPPSPPDVLPPAVDLTTEEVDEEEIEAKVRQIIETHRQSIGLFTRWNTELPPIVLPMVDSYERQKVIGQPLGVHSLASEALRQHMKPFHSFRAAPAVTNCTNPNAVFRALVKTKKGMEILSSRDDDASFVIVVRTTPYPNGLTATWALLGIDSVTPAGLQ